MDVWNPHLLSHKMDLLQSMVPRCRNQLHCCLHVRTLPTIAKNLCHIFALGNIFSKFCQFFATKSWRKQTIKHCHSLLNWWMKSKDFRKALQKIGNNCYFCSGSGWQNPSSQTLKLAIFAKMFESFAKIVGFLAKFLAKINKN